MEVSDETLVADAQAGQARAFGTLVSRHYDRIYRLSYRMLGQRAEAEDLAQDVCATLASRLRSFRGEAKFTTWLHRLVINAAKDRLRRRTTYARATEGWGDWEVNRKAEIAEAQEEQRWLAEALQGLSPDLRATVALVLGEDMNHREAAAELGISEGTVSWRMSEVRRALTTLREEEKRA
ncbi:RNA polymerase sigma factor [Algicella marina]|uniref:Sigma-70 family RNA polymerase sigma factor n=1 Tax=Algicella marina TaxID=2683284 RepID=A0A6P1T2Z9_9RHOB|nr:RNA polymerase sigma factor [Algicella marina]QHQ36121.1 sigma-70 family RNA polymerase sigma factor [Algicella marina]